MKITEMNKKENVEKQYSNDEKLSIRINLHQTYSTNKQGFGNFLYSQYDIKEGDKILELGSGNGTLWQAHMDTLSNRVELYLSDFSQGMVDILIEKYKSYNVTIKVIDIEEIPYPDNEFDILIANMMLYHVPNLHKGLSEVRRVLKPEGVFYAATFGENGLSEYLNQVLKELDMVKEEKIDYIFKLQKGTKILLEHFDEVERVDYIDQLEITNIKDLINYIKTMGVMGGITSIDEEKLKVYFESKKNETGKLIIPKEYGTFVSR